MWCASKQSRYVPEQHDESSEGGCDKRDESGIDSHRWAPVLVPALATSRAPPDSVGLRRRCAVAVGSTFSRWFHLHRNDLVADLTGPVGGEETCAKFFFEVFEGQGVETVAVVGVPVAEE